MAGLRLITGLGLLQYSALATVPTCNYTTNADVKWTTCPLDWNAWYGVSTAQYDYDNAVYACQAAGGELITITTPEIDACAYKIIYASQKDQEMILFAGRQATGDVWGWCPRLSQGTSVQDGCDEQFEFTHWTDNGPVGNCMGGYLATASYPTYDDYSWLQRSCAELVSSPVNVMCRLACDAIEPTPTVTPSAPPTTQPTTETAPVAGGTQFIAFSVAEESKSADQYIYKAEINGGQIQPSSTWQKFTVPYTQAKDEHKLPHLTYNYQIDALEVVGDIYDQNNNHYQLKNWSSWSKVTNRLFDGRKRAGLEYVDGVGTIIVGGYDKVYFKPSPIHLRHSTSKTVKIITPNTDWPTYTNHRKYFLRPLSHRLDNMATSVYLKRLYVAGGYDSDNNVNTLQMIDFNDISGIKDAQKRKWQKLNHLSFKGDHGVLFAYSKTLWYGASGGANALEVYDLPNEKASSQSLLKYEPEMSAAFLSLGANYPYEYSGNLTIFLGRKSSSSCPVMTQTTNDIASGTKFNCVTKAADGSTIPSSFAGKRVSYANYYPWWNY